MKHFYYTLLFFGCSLLVSGQTILNKTETARTVQDPNAVILAPGFSEKGTTTNTFIARIGTLTEIPPASPNNSVAGQNNPSGETISTLNGSIFHDTKGDIAVGSSGQLTFSLPIALPPGINNVAPQMNLTYTSGSGNGIAGYGWNLSGLTNIARVAKNIEKDGDIKGVQLDYTDYYQFNGDRLLLKSGEYGKNGAEYVTEKFSNLKIKSIGAITGQSYQGPESWEVTFDDGSQAWYGTNPNSRTPLEYNITKWKDAQGNYMTYNYSQNNRVAQISSVQWGGNETLSKPHFNEILFEYAVRDSKELAYSNGLEFTQQSILTNVVVNTNSALFKKYVLTYKKDANNTQYQYVDKITEYNSQNQAANPVVFNYEQSINSNWNTKNFTDTVNQKITGDFDGDGVLDYLAYYEPYTDCIEYNESNYTCIATVQRSGGINLFSSFLNAGNLKKKDVTSSISPISKIELSKAIAITFIDSNKKVSTRQGLLVKKEKYNATTKLSDIILEIYAIDNNILTLKISKTISGALYDIDTEGIEGNPDEGEYSTLFSKVDVDDVKTLDVNGDGLSEVLINYTQTNYITRYTSDPDYPITSGNNLQRSVIIVDLNPELSPESSVSLFPSAENIYNNSQRTVDFNGDGKLEILGFNNAGNPFTIEFNKSTVTNKYEQSYKSFNSNIIGLYKDAVYGDFNGDGKTDMLVPVALGTPVSTGNMQVGGGNYAYYLDRFLGDWRLYLSTGNGFKEEYKSALGKWYPSQILQLSNVTATRRINYQAFDLDKDGKSELVQFDFYTINSKLSAGKYTETTINVFSNIGASNTNNVNFNRVYNYSFKNNNEIFDYTELVGNYQIIKTINNIAILGKNRNDSSKGLMSSFSFYDNTKAKRINTIVQGGISTEIIYTELIPCGSIINQYPIVYPQLKQGFYEPVKTEVYPYVESDKLTQSFAVSQLRQAGRKQDFKYRGFISHLTGKGMLGFRQTARSSWYADGFENAKIWSASEIDPLNNSVPIKEWSTRDENNIFPADINENTAGLLSFKKTDYQTTTLPLGVEALVTKSTLQKDFLTQVTTTSNIEEYDEYFLPKKSVTSTNNGFGTKTTHLTYEHNATGTGNSYYIGRLKTKEEIVTAYNDTKKSKQEYTYSNNQVETIKTYNNDYSGYVLEKIDLYDGFGNVLEKTTTNSVDGQTTKVKDVYDDKGRFVTKKTDNLGLEVNMTYNNWGQLLTQIDPLGNTVTNTYDAWGKPLTSHDNLSGYLTYKYEKQNFITTVTKYSPDGGIESTTTNAKGETVLVRTKAFNTNQYIEKAVTYDVLGRKTGESEPYLSTETPKWNMIEYDESVFPPIGTATAFNGKKVESKVDGRTTIITELNGYKRVTRKTTDALGNVIESEDKGGTIQFTYNAAGQNLTATYGTNVVTTTYDTWGRKASFHDPSNGLYSYTYHGFGQLNRETSPKGYKEYGYNNLGQLKTQIEKSSDGSSTNKSITFTYDNKGRITNRQGTSNGKAFSSYITYDAQGRSIASGENSNNRYYLKKNVIYDDKGRVTSYEKGMYSGGTYTKAIIENIYSPWSGDLYLVKDKTAQKVLWQLDVVKANGQVLNAKLGAVSITNIYDANNFLKTVSHTVSGQTPVTVLGLGYTFEAIKNELNQRTRAGFGVATEDFVYDDNNRLLNWTNPKTGLLSNNIYDEKGRITTNDQLGKVNFNNPAKVYQATSIEPNAALPQHWPDAATILQKITYNENNDPLYLDGKNGDYAFEYGLGESRQAMHYGGNFDPALASQQAKFSKYYSEDGSYEVILDRTTGKEKHLMYIGGSPYESDIVLLKDFAETTAKYVFLHKDYLGTILAISNEQGQVVEQRHFDAWGILTHGEIKLIDRGYTSHEHLQDVGIIHMNGRLYDPLMRRFLNADENIQDPYNTQNYNKYGYVMNNPLLFNDPSGEVIFLGIAMALVVKAMIIGAIVSSISYTIGLAVTGNLNQASAGGALKAMFFGAVSGAVTCGIGSLFSSVGANGLQTATSLADALGKTGTVFVGAACHAVAQGALSMVQGGKFLTGATAGFLGHLGGEGWSNTVGNSDVGTIAFGALSGGIGAEFTGGNFWTGAVTGGIVAGLNTALHKMGENGEPDPPSKYKKWFSARMKEASALLDEIGNWGSNVGTAAGMTLDWATGSGASSTIFIEGRVANAMSNANRVNQARSFYYNKYKGVSNLKGTSVEGFKGSFGLSGILHAGLDPIEQFIGTYRINIYNISGKSLWFVLTNQTSMNSFLYYLGPSYNRSTFGPGGNTNQTYIWNEPVRR